MLTVLAMFALGVVSALVPVVNAELALGAVAVASDPPLALVAAVAIAAGQTAGKVVIFEAARAGGSRWRRARPDASGRWRRRLAALPRGRWPAVAVVLTSASIGLPPLVLVSGVAGAVPMRRVDFVLCCLTGRVVRFGALALAVVWSR